MVTDSKKCAACSINTVEGRNSKCESCKIALRRVETCLAVYKHRNRQKAGKARHNRTYRGRPTAWVVENALRILETAGVFQQRPAQHA